jgi:hypothetical protein
MRGETLHVWEYRDDSTRVGVRGCVRMVFESSGVFRFEDLKHMYYPLSEDFYCVLSTTLRKAERDAIQYSFPRGQK